MQEIVVIDGEIELENTLDGEVELEAITDLDPDVVMSAGGGIVYPHYTGSYTVTPSGSVQTLDTSDKVMDDDVTIQAVPQGSATTPATIITANPTLSRSGRIVTATVSKTQQITPTVVEGYVYAGTAGNIGVSGSDTLTIPEGSATTPATTITANPTVTVSSGGLITAKNNKTQQITPTVVEGYVSAGTAGNVSVSGYTDQQLTVQSAQTLHPSTMNQSIASGKYLTGTLTFKAVTVSGLTADKVVQGHTVKIGDADDDDRIMSVTGTASGGITPTGTKQITANGTGIDVYSYQYADVAVPNSYSASDEGKVVSNGALVAQTSDTVTTNDTYDTTLINSLTVNVSGGGGNLGGLANMVDVVDPEYAFAYMLSQMKNGNTAGGTVTYTEAFTQTEQLILSTGLTTVHGFMFACPTYDVTGNLGSGQSNKFVMFLFHSYQSTPAHMFAVGLQQGGSTIGARTNEPLETRYDNSPIQGIIRVSGGDIYYSARYNKNANYQIVRPNVQYEWLAW